jgi:tetratricopeptide (TPR) repeat protein
MNANRSHRIASFVMLMIGMMLLLTVTSAGAQKKLSTPEATTTPSKTPTLTDGEQIVQTVNSWQKDLMDPSIAIGKYILTFVVLVILICLLFYTLVRLISPTLGQIIINGGKQILTRFREEQIVITEFENAADKDSDYLAKIVKARMAEELREQLSDNGKLGRLRKNFKDRHAERNIGEKQQDKTGEFFDDLISKVGNTEIKVLALIVRWLFPVQGTRVSGHLIKVGASPENHGLVVELSDLATEETTKSHTFWGSLVYPRFHEIARLPIQAKGKTKSEKTPQKVEYKLGLIYENKGFYGDAKTHYESAIKVNPSYKDALAALERVLDKDESNTAKMYCDLTEMAAKWVGCYIVSRWLPKSKLDHQNKSQVLNYLGVLFTELLAYEDAVDELEESIKIDKDSYFPFWNLGNVYSYLDKQEDAINAYDQALILAKKARDAKEDVQTIELACANSLWASNKKERANKSVNQVVKSSPSSAQVMYELACFYSRAGDVDKALGWLKIAVRDKSMKKELGEWVWSDPDLENIRGEKEFTKLFPPSTLI